MYLILTHFCSAPNIYNIYIHIKLPRFIVTNQSALNNVQNDNSNHLLSLSSTTTSSNDYSHQGTFATVDPIENSIEDVCHLCAHEQVSIKRTLEENNYHQFLVPDLIDLLNATNYHLPHESSHVRHINDSPQQMNDPFSSENDSSDGYIELAWASLIGERGIYRSENFNIPHHHTLTNKKRNTSPRIQQPSCHYGEKIDVHTQIKCSHPSEMNGIYINATQNINSRNVEDDKNIPSKDISAVLEFERYHQQDHKPGISIPIHILSEGIHSITRTSGIIL